MRCLILCLLAVVQLVLPALSPAPVALPCTAVMEICCGDEECPCSVKACTCRPADPSSERETEKPGAVGWHGAGLVLALIHGSGTFEFAPLPPPRVIDAQWDGPIVRAGCVQAWLQIWRT